MFVKNLFAGALAIAGAVAPAVASPTNYAITKNPDGFANTVYYTSWSVYGRNFTADRITTDKITHINYAFVTLDKDGTVVLSDAWADVQRPMPGDEQPGSFKETVDGQEVIKYNALGNVKQLFKLKQQNRRLKTLISFGGFTMSTNFTFVAADETARTKFAEESVKLMADWGFDGIDIDWEYPESKADGENYITMLQAIRTELDKYAAATTPGYHYLLNVAVSAGATKYDFLNMKGLGEVCDHINLMAYDYAGSWSTETGHMANLFASKSNSLATTFDTNTAVEAYLAGGVPSHKLILGMPVYGRSFMETEGMGKPYKGIGPGTWEEGAYDYKVLPLEGAEEFYDKDVVGQYSYDKEKKQLISYDTPEVVMAKAKYMKKMGLGGSMFWEASADKTGDQSLIGTAFQSQGGVFKSDCSQNQLHYPKSQYANIATLKMD